MIVVAIAQKSFDQCDDDDEYAKDYVFAVGGAVQKSTAVPVPYSFASCPSCSLENCADCCSETKHEKDTNYACSV